MGILQPACDLEQFLFYGVPILFPQCERGTWKEVIIKS